MAKTRGSWLTVYAFQIEIIEHVKSKIHEHDECELE